ncbi:hypothetical protein [Jatrophihabitans sp.]|uniref:hypothetical protein n=1 Tax=Jatrophihabitans sp. TaxID=1932789 RepID=UPI002C6C7064|nr:hypothetical protein [Jatrophihabitans sp.]
MDTNRGDSYSATVNAPVTGQFAVGRDIAQTSTDLGGAAEHLSPAQVSELAELFAGLRSDVASGAPPAQRAEALSKVVELETAIAAEDKPDLVTMDYVRGWFSKHLPHLAGVVVSLIVHPLVGQLVTAAGESMVAEFHHRFH